MICRYCHHEFTVDASRIGEKLPCPNCCIPIEIGTKTLIRKCPACQTPVQVEMWLWGNEVRCPECREIFQTTLSAATCHAVFSKKTPVNDGTALSPGTRWGKYNIECCLGTGGMSEVYLATHLYLGTSCAIKLFKKDMVIEKNDKLRFLQEARLASQLRHPNLVAVQDADIDPASGMLYIVMEYVDGIALDLLLAQQPLPEKRTLQLVRQVAEALQSAAKMQLVHRDIKPANIIFSSKGNAKLADLGIAKANEQIVPSLSMDNAILGTPNYAPPEQLQVAGKVDVRADIYSLGATMYHMLSGQPPFNGDTAGNIIQQVIEKMPPPLQSKAKASPLTIQLVHEMMAKNPDERPADMTEVISRIDRILLAYPESSSGQTPLPATEADDKKDVAATKPAIEIKLEHRPKNKNSLAKAPMQTEQQAAAPSVKRLTCRTPQKEVPRQEPKPAASAEQRKFKLLVSAGTVFALALAVAGIFFIRHYLAKVQAEEEAEKLARASAVSERAAQNPARFNLYNRIAFAAKQAHKLENDKERDNDFLKAQKQFNLRLSGRLQQEWNIRQNSPRKRLKRRSGTLFANNSSDLLVENAPLLLQQETAHAAFYQQLNTYAREIQESASFSSSPAGQTLRAKLRQQFSEFDPLLLVQAVYLLCEEKKDTPFSGQTILAVLHDLNPDFSYSKFPPSALALPENILLDLLARSWDEVDGVSYARSTLAAELARSTPAPRPAVISALLAAGCNPDLANVHGLRPLHLALQCKNIELVETLLLAAPDLNITLDGENLVEWGIFSEALPEALERLCYAGADMPQDLTPEDVDPEYASLWKPHTPGKYTLQLSETSQETVAESSRSTASGPLPPEFLHAATPLAKSLSIAVNAEAGQHTEKFTLAGRAAYAQQKLNTAQNMQRTHGSNIYNQSAIEFYKKLNTRLQQELQAYQNAPRSGAKTAVPVMYTPEKSLRETMPILLNPSINSADKRTQQFNLLRFYAVQLQEDPLYKIRTAGQKALQELQAHHAELDPVFYIQAMLTLVLSKEEVSPQTMLRILADLNPDFSSSKLPPEVLELPEPVILALLQKSWAEVDGVSFGKSHLITELSRADNGGRPEVIAALLAAGCNVDTADAQGLYPLHWAVKNDRFLRQILTAAPDLNISVNRKGLIEWCMDNNIRYSIARRLRQAGAPLPSIREDQYNPLYRALLHLAPNGSR